MLQKDISYVKNTLDANLGYPQSRNGEFIYKCPFCNHHKHKLQVNLENEKWHCWVCNSKGKKITSLLRRLDVDINHIKKISQIYKDNIYVKVENDTVINLQLPSEFKSLLIEPKSINPLYKKSIKYLHDRGFTEADIIKYNIGFCDTGTYGGRVIIPSYDSDNKLNYFIARSVYDDVTLKYLNPKVSKNVIMFENQINWDYPIILTEGIFDAMTIRRNAIPLLSKFIPKKLIEKIYMNGVKNITIVLDDDAIKDSLNYTTQFMNNGIDIKFVKPSGKDANEIGFEKITDDIMKTNNTQFDDLIRYKLELI